MKYFGRLLLAVVLLGGMGCAANRASPDSATAVREEGSIDAMGSVTTIVAYGNDPKRLQTAISDALDEMRRLDDMLSNYKPQSEWSRMNRLANQQPVSLSDELFSLLAACVEYSHESEGTFDISVGPLMKVWGFYKGSGHLPDAGAVSHALQSVGYR